MPQSRPPNTMLPGMCLLHADGKMTHKSTTSDGQKLCSRKIPLWHANCGLLAASNYFLVHARVAKEVRSMQTLGHVGDAACVSYQRSTDDNPKCLFD